MYFKTFNIIKIIRELTLNAESLNKTYEGGAFSHQHPVSLPLIEFAFEAGGDEIPQLREKALHYQVRQNLVGKFKIGTQHNHLN